MFVGLLVMCLSGSCNVQVAPSPYPSEAACRFEAANVSANFADAKEAGDIPPGVELTFIGCFEIPVSS